MERDDRHHPEGHDPFAISRVEHLDRLEEAARRLSARIDREGIDLDAPAHPLAHMETAKQLAEVSIWASTLIERLGLDPEFMLNLKLAELRQGDNP